MTIQFIRLTECNGNVVIINVNQIEHITVGTRGQDTYVKLIGNTYNPKPTEIMGKEKYFFVKETVEDIWVWLKEKQHDK